MGLKCKQLTTEAVCFTDADGLKTSLVAHYEYGQDATDATILVATIYTDAEGTPVDTADGVVTVGSCPKPDPVIQTETYCDDVEGDGSDIVQFICQTVTSFDDNCVPIVPAVVNYFELDKVTVYVPVGDIGVCDGDCAPAVAGGLKTAWGATKG